jgi:hypothetical protein
MNPTVTYQLRAIAVALVLSLVAAITVLLSGTHHSHLVSKGDPGTFCLSGFAALSKAPGALPRPKVCFPDIPNDK